MGQQNNTQPVVVVEVVGIVIVAISYTGVVAIVVEGPATQNPIFSRPVPTQSKGLCTLFLFLPAAKQATDLRHQP
jgi:hypothetical protein